MRLLLDSQGFLWFVWDAPQLSQTAKNLIGDPDNEILVSVATIWELSIKVSTGKLALTQPLAAFFTSQLALNDFGLLPITLDHASYVASLPFHHKDPFDRLLVAQSLLDRLPIVSADPVFDSYGVSRLW